MWWCTKIDKYEVCCVLCQSIPTGCNQRMEVCFQKIYNDTMRNESSKSYGGQTEPRKIQMSSCLLLKKKGLYQCVPVGHCCTPLQLLFDKTQLFGKFGPATQFQCFIVISFALCKYFNIPALGRWWFSVKS